MLNPTTGHLTFDDAAISIAPDLTREPFLATPWGESAKHWMTNEPWHSWRLDGTVPSTGIPFIVVLYFHAQTLTAVHLVHSDPKFGTSWDDHTMKKQMARKDSHDAWLDACIGSERKFNWGEVFSVYDEKVGESVIKIQYVPANP